jgi:hypothetical protein
LVHGTGAWSGEQGSDKRENDQEFGKTMGITSESMLANRSAELKTNVIGTLSSLVPRLFIPWNPHGCGEEHAFRRLVHTMKKKIL